MTIKNSSKLVFICDDDPGMRKVLTLALEGNYRIRSFGAVADMLNALEQEKVRPQLILTDLVLHEAVSEPGNPEALVRTVRTGIPVIVISGWHEGRKIALDFGAADFFGKPFSVAALLDKVAALTAG